jgi:hypothetical protein
MFLARLIQSQSLTTTRPTTLVCAGDSNLRSSIPVMRRRATYRALACLRRSSTIRVRWRPSSTSNTPRGNLRRPTAHSELDVQLDSSHNRCWSGCSSNTAGNQANNDGNTSGDYIYKTFVIASPISATADFVVSLSPQSRTITPGSSAPYTVNRNSPCGLHRHR